MLRRNIADHPVDPEKDTITKVDTEGQDHLGDITNDAIPKIAMIRIMIDGISSERKEAEVVAEGKEELICLGEIESEGKVSIATGLSSAWIVPPLNSLLRMPLLFQVS